VKEKKTFCYECRKDVAFEIKKATVVSTYRGGETEYVEKIGVCSECGGSVYFKELIDENLKSLYDAYRKKYNYISLEQTKEIPKKYAIGKRPLSLLLEWGELTYTRYCEGYMPSKLYADVMQRLYDEPEYYQEILESRKKLITEAAYRKSKKAVAAIIEARDSDADKAETAVRRIELKMPLYMHNALVERSNSEELPFAQYCLNLLSAGLGNGKTAAG
jgi:hypothetical protein